MADVVDAHLLAMDRAPGIGFGRYIISATTPFTRDDLVALRTDAPAVVRRRFADQEAEYARRGWRMFPGIDRVYVNAHARAELRLGAALRLPPGAGRARGRRRPTQPARRGGRRQGLPRRIHRPVHHSVAPIALNRPLISC